jgi:biopolymer transport protein ExbB
MDTVVSAISLWKLMSLGGPMMWPLSLCPCAALAVFFERRAFFSGLEAGTAALRKEVFSALSSNDIRTACAVCDRSGLPSARIMKAGLIEYREGPADIARAMENAGRLETDRLDWHLHLLNYLAYLVIFFTGIASVSGLGMVVYAFYVRGFNVPYRMPPEVFGGLIMMLVAFTAGLLAAALVFAVYYYCSLQISAFVHQSEADGADLASLMAHCEEKNLQDLEDQRADNEKL